MQTPIFTETTDHAGQWLKFTDYRQDEATIHTIRDFLQFHTYDSSGAIDLSPDHVRELIPRLQSWLDNGTIHINPKKWTIRQLAAEEARAGDVIYSNQLRFIVEATGTPHCFSLATHASATLLCDLLNRLDP
jgi:hypothetical protein